MNEATIKITGVERELLPVLTFDYFTDQSRGYSQKDLLLIHHLLFVTKKEN
jgi:hypothetical protein